MESPCLSPSFLLLPLQIVLVKHFVPITSSSVHQTSCQSNQMKLEMFEDLRIHFPDSLFSFLSVFSLNFPSSLSDNIPPHLNFISMEVSSLRCSHSVRTLVTRMMYLILNSKYYTDKRSVHLFIPSESCTQQSHERERDGVREMCLW